MAVLTDWEAIKINLPAVHAGMGRLKRKVWCLIGEWPGFFQLGENGWFWSAFMKVFVLGGNGFIGKNLCESLIKDGHDVRAFGLRSNGDEWPKISGVEWVEGNFTRTSDVSEAIDDAEILFHLVSTTLPKSSNDNPVADLKGNVESTLHLLDAMTGMNKPPKIVFISSGGTVYGVPNSVPISESHPTDPICAYGVGKLAIEKYLFLYHKLHGIEYRILRLANPYGEHQALISAQGVIPVFLKRALLGEDLEVWGDGTVVRDYVYIGDVMNAMRAVMCYDGNERVFNIGSGHGISINEIIALMERVMAQKIICRYYPSRLFDVPSNILDIRRAQISLGWSPELSLEEGLVKMLKYVRELLGK